MEGIRIIEIPKVKMISSGHGTLDELFEKKFDKLILNQRKDFTPHDFMWYDPERNKMVWYYAVTHDDIDPCGFEIIDFEGGLYAAAISIDENEEDGERVYNGIKEWINNSECFELDERPGHYCMFHIVTPSEVKKAMGYNQLDIFVPIKVTTSNSAK